MTVTSAPYGGFLAALPAGTVDFGADDFKAMLTTSGYTPNVDTHVFLAAVTNEITGTGYTAGGQALTGLGISYDATNHWAVIAADPLVWATATFTARRLIVYKDTGSSATSLLVGYIDYGVDQSPVSEDFTVNFASGLVRLRKYIP
jgi:hypothetical protein